MPKRLLSVVLAALAPFAVAAVERRVGGPCEGCELALVGMPDALPAELELAPSGEPGTPLVVEGTVYTRDGRTPAAGTILYLYQTAASGRYERDPSGTRHGRLRGWVRVGADGRYVVRTVRPGAYPGRTAAAHIHVVVREPGVFPYYVDDIVFDDDPLVDTAYRAARENRGGDGITHPETRDGVEHVRRDVVLGRNVPGY